MRRSGDIGFSVHPVWSQATEDRTTGNQVPISVFRQGHHRFVISLFNDWALQFHHQKPQPMPQEGRKLSIGQKKKISTAIGNAKYATPNTRKYRPCGWAFFVAVKLGILAVTRRPRVGLQSLMCFLIWELKILSFLRFFPTFPKYFLPVTSEISSDFRQ